LDVALASSITLSITCAHIHTTALLSEFTGPTCAYTCTLS
jgi:hypothetical protein